MTAPRTARIALAGITSSLLACQPPARSQPDTAYRAFVEAARAAHAGAEPTLLERFDASTRAALQARATAASEATNKQMPPDPTYQLLLGDGLAPSVTAVHVTSIEGSRAQLLVETDGGSAPVTMVDERGWKVHLDL